MVARTWRLHRLTPLALAALAGCAFLPGPRAVRPGEVLTLQELQVALPEGPGWTVDDLAVKERRVVHLRHTAPDGHVDQEADVVETEAPPDFLGVAVSCGGCRPVLTALAAPGAAAVPQPFGPASARIAYRMETGNKERRGGLDVATWLLASPTFQRGYRLTWMESASGPAAGPPPPVEEPFQARAASFFERAALRPADATGPVTPPEARLEVFGDLLLGVESWKDGDTWTGFSEKIRLGIDQRRPSGWRFGWDVDLGLASASRGDRGAITASAVAVGTGLSGGWGPLRLRAGLEAIVLSTRDRNTRITDSRTSLGGALGLSAELLKLASYPVLLQADATTGDGGYRAAALTLGLRFR